MTDLLLSLSCCNLLFAVFLAVLDVFVEALFKEGPMAVLAFE
jgi:hypothetical protein